MIGFILAGCGGGPPAANHPPHVDARALDDTGWTAEITRGIGGFAY